MEHTAPDPIQPHLPYSWLAHIPPITTEELRTSQERQPVIHEGYIPSSLPNASLNGAYLSVSGNATYHLQDILAGQAFDYSSNVRLTRPQSSTPRITPSSENDSRAFGFRGAHYTPYAAAIHPPPVHSGYVPDSSAASYHYPEISPSHGSQDPGSAHFADIRPHGILQGHDQTSAFERTRLSSYDVPEYSQAESTDEGEMTMDEGESLAVTHALIAGGMNAGSTSGKRGPEPEILPGQSSRKRRKRGKGRRGGWSKGLKIGPRPAIEPSPEFNELHQQALNAFIDEQDTEKARDLILQAIALNPEIYAAHALLSEIYFARGEDEKAIAALFSGAHSAARDAEVWRLVASVCLQHSANNRHRALQQASYCYARIIHNDRQDYDARLERAAISKELGNYGKAIKDLEAVLEGMPRNANVMKQIAEVGIETKSLGRAMSLYEDLLTYSRSPGLEGEDTFTWAHAVTYIELLSHNGPPDEARSNAIVVLRQLCRWLLGREEDFFWDNFDDDREWDVEDEPRRIMVPQHVPDIFPSESYGLGLPLELRVQLGILRLKQGSDHFDEALDHLEWLEPEARDEQAHIYEFPDLFLEAANALYVHKEHEQALRYFEALRDVNAYSDVDFWLAIATCYYVTGDKLQAVDCYEAAKEADIECGEARIQLAKLYTDLEEKEKAMVNAREAIRIAEQATPQTDKRRYERKEQRLARKAAENALKEAYRLRGPLAQGDAIDRIEARLQRGNAKEDVVSFRKPRQRKEKPAPQPRSIPNTRPPPLKKPMTPAEKDAYRTDAVTRLYTNLLENAEGMREGDELAIETWTNCATSLIMDFRSNRFFYPYERSLPFMGYHSRHKIMQQTQAEDPSQGFSYLNARDIPTAYREIPFTAWLDIFLEYALVLASKGNKTRCYNTIIASLDCAVWYHDPNAQLLIHTTYLACCISLRDQATLVNVVLRWFLRTYQFCTDAYRLFAAMNLVFPYTNEKNGKEGVNANLVFRSGPSQKFMFRQIMSMDLNLPTDYYAEGFGPVPDFMRRTRDQIQKDDGKSTTENPVTGGGNTAAGDAALEPPATAGPTEGITLQEMDVVLLTLYGHLLYAGGSFPSALSYFFRALSLDPQNPVILLTISLSYIHEMMKRQNENRHLYLLQAWSFFEEYADARRASAQSTEDDNADNNKNIDNFTVADSGADVGGVVPDKAGRAAPTTAMIEAEIEFNRARCWHMLGMADLAVRAYGKVLTLQRDIQLRDRGSAVSPSDEASNTSATRDDGGHGNQAAEEYEKPDFSAPPGEYTMEAAYAIQTMYALSGNAAMARSVAERYLVV
ncbi:uncharacterized protein A1O9_06327 [Exophiala aquamarina CBS 119918]|uniref:TPR-like protein n=1 Tax=Exophiala aquamarina CBS 119918 TaxID=1182545 RepID=A0A072PEV0_9EURO|nr:uncharacterized protein A1O9_06327 [Exophiala aquamarina CBS 119918]KEF58401.1 hypothetical protein A1O9_06327 [Exophiala aquamarina CBS 119918]